MTPAEEQALALGGIFEAALQVDKLARTGKYNEGPAGCLIQSIFERTPDSAIDVYGGSFHQVRGGLQALAEMLERDTAALQRVTVEILRGRMRYNIGSVFKRTA